MQKIRKFFTENIFLKILSLCIAVILWFVVINIENPIKVRTYNVALDVLNEDAIVANNFILSNEEELKSTNIQVKIEAPKAELDELERYLANLDAFIDLSLIDFSQANETTKPYTAQVEVKLPSFLDENKYSIVEVMPSEVNIVLDKYINKSFPIEVSVKGNPAEGFVTYPPSFDPKEAIISGAKTDIESIAKVMVDVDISGLNSDAVISVPPQVYDKDGKNITSRLNISIPTVEVTVPIDKFGKIPISPPEIYGNPPSGYRVVGVTVDPVEIDVVGSKEDVENFIINGGIILPSVDVSGKNITFTQTFPIAPYLEGTAVSAGNDTPSEVAITVYIEKQETKVITMATTSLNVAAGDEPYEFRQPTIQFPIKGYEDTLKNANAQNIQGSIDISGLDVGNHNVPVQISLPQGVTLIGSDPLVNIEILDVPTDAIATETAVPSPSEGTLSPESTDQDELIESPQTAPPQTTPTSANVEEPQDTGILVVPSDGVAVESPPEVS